MSDTEEKWQYGTLTIDDINEAVNNLMWVDLAGRFAIGFIAFDRFRPDVSENDGWVSCGKYGPKYHNKQLILMHVGSVLHKQIKKMEECCKFIRFERIDEKSMEELWKELHFVFTDEDGVFIDLSEKPVVEELPILSNR